MINWISIPYGSCVKRCPFSTQESVNLLNFAICPGKQAERQGLSDASPIFSRNARCSRRRATSASRSMVSSPDIICRIVRSPNFSNAKSSQQIHRRVTSFSMRWLRRQEAGTEVWPRGGEPFSIALCDPCTVRRRRWQSPALESQEPGTDGTVTVFETGRDEAVFHHGQFSAGLCSRRTYRYTQMLAGAYPRFSFLHVVYHPLIATRQQSSGSYFAECPDSLISTLSSSFRLP